MFKCILLIYASWINPSVCTKVEETLWQNLNYEIAQQCKILTNYSIKNTKFSNNLTTGKVIQAHMLMFVASAKKFTHKCQFLVAFMLHITNKFNLLIGEADICWGSTSKSLACKVCCSISSLTWGLNYLPTPSQQYVSIGLYYVRMDFT